MARIRLFSILSAAALGAGVYAWVATGADDPTAQTAGADGDAASTEASSAEALSATQTAVPASDGRVAAPPRTIRVRASRSVAQPLAESLVLRGVSEAARKVEVRAETEGLVISEPLLRGAAVEAGQVLCEIEAGERPARLAEARANLARAEADIDASQSLSKKGFRSQTDLAADAAALEAARASVALMALDIRRTRIVAPFEGRLETDSAKPGELLQRGSTCATLIALDPIKFVGFAPERAIDAVKVGAPATARLISGESVAARVTFVARSADPNTRTFQVEATAPNPNETVRDGATVEIATPLDPVPAHLAPRSALTLDEAGRLGVRVVRPIAGVDPSVRAIAGFAPVTILRDGPDGVWLGGLPDEVDLIVLGQEFVRDGANIAARYDTPPAESQSQSHSQ